MAVLSPIWVNFSLSENEMHDVPRAGRQGPRAPARRTAATSSRSSWWTARSSPTRGRITFAAPSFSAQTGTFLLRASVLNPEGILRPNAYVRVRLTGAVRPNAIVVPQRAVQQGSEGHFVWVVDKEGKARPRPVEVGRWHGSDWLVSEGLRSGDQVIVDGALALHAGGDRRREARGVAPCSRGSSSSGRSSPSVVSIILCLAGLVAMTALPVEQYPTITPVQVTVSAIYPGADSKTLADSVAAPIEAQINGVDNMLYMSSTSSSTGMLTLTVYFTLDTDPDVAQVQVQNRVNLAVPQLPSAVVQQGVSVQKKSSSIMMLIGVYSKEKRYSRQYIANYANVYVLDAIKRVPGAGQASIMGVPDQAMRVWMNPDRMASLGITTSDIQKAIASQNALYGAGQIGQQPTAGPVELTFPVVTQQPYTEPEGYENIILRAGQGEGAIVRLKDVARVEVGLRQYVIDSRLNGLPATFIAVYQQPGANALQVSKAVHAALEGMKARFPDGLDYLVSLDTTEFVRLSIDEVIHTLFEAIVLVVLVVYLFLQSFRATLICSTAVVVALLGTFPFMLAAGFSINLLTLFGLVLAIGIVVDDAIVVVENVERNMSQKHLGGEGGHDQRHGRGGEPGDRDRAGHGLDLRARRLPARARPASSTSSSRSRSRSRSRSPASSPSPSPRPCAASSSGTRRPPSAASSPGSTGSSTPSPRPSAARWCSSSGGWRSPSCSSPCSWASSSPSSRCCRRASCRTRTRAT